VGPEGVEPITVTLKDGIVTAEYRPAFRVLAQMAAELTPPPNVRGGSPGVRN